MAVDPNRVLVGIDGGARIVQGNFFRLTFGRARRLGLPIELFDFAHDAQVVFDRLDAADGWAQPVSDFTVQPGQEAAVFDVLVRPVAIGVTAADLANYFDGLRFGITLTSMTPVDVATVQTGAAERDALQNQLDVSEKSRDPLAVFGHYARVLEWLLVAVLVVALVFGGAKLLQAVRRRA